MRLRLRRTSQSLLYQGSVLTGTLYEGPCIWGLNPFTAVQNS